MLWDTQEWQKPVLIIITVFRHRVPCYILHASTGLSGEPQFEFQRDRALDRIAFLENTV